MAAESIRAASRRKAIEQLGLSSTARSGSDRSTWSGADTKTFEAITAGMRQMSAKHHRISIPDVKDKDSERMAALANMISNDKRFNYNIEDGSFQSVQSGICLLEAQQTACQHELCQRSLKQDGISYLEYDTITYYEKRIASAKGQRMKDALRKQRDHQLQKDKTDMDDWTGQVLKKMKTFGQNALDSMFKAATGNHMPARIPLIDVRENTVMLVGRKLSDLRHKLLSADKQRFGTYVTRRIFENPNGALHSWRTPMHCLEFLGRMNHNHIDAVIQTVNETLDSNATQYYEVDYCFRAFLQQYKQLLKYVTRSRKSSPVVTVAEIFMYIVQLIKNEGEYQDSRILTSLPHGDLCDALFDCALLDLQARSAMHQVARRCVAKLEYPDGHFDPIREQGVKISYVSSISKISVDAEMHRAWARCTLSVLSKKILLEPRVKVVQELVQQLRTFTNKSLSRREYVADILYSHLRELGLGQGQLGDQTPDQVEIYAILSEADNIRKSEEDIEMQNMKADVFTARKKAEAAYNEDGSQLINASHLYFAGMMFCNGKDVLISFAEDFLLEQSTRNTGAYRIPWITKLRMNAWRGIAEAFWVYKHFHPDPDLIELGDDCLIFDEEEKVDWILFDRDEQSVSTFFMRRREQGWCAPSAFMRLLVIITRISASNPQFAREKITILEDYASNAIEDVCVSWRALLKPLSHVVRQMLGFLTIECLYVLGRYDVEQVVWTMICCTMAHIVIAKSESQAKAGAKFTMQFLRFILCIEEKDHSYAFVRNIEELLINIAENETLRCEEKDSCITYFDVCDESEEDRPKEVPAISRLGAGPRCVVKVPKVSITHRKTGTKPLPRKAELQNETLTDIVCGKIAVLDAAAALKYIAYRIKMFESSKPDAAAVDTLSRAFTKLERVINKTPGELPSQVLSSMNIGMHNNCNVWELSESKIKTSCFFNGYMNGIRDSRDVDCLVSSMHTWALQSWNFMKPNAFAFLAERLAKLAGSFFMGEVFHERFEKEAEIHAEKLTTSSLAVKCIVSRLDYILSRHSGHRYPTIYFLLDLLEGCVDNFFEFCDGLQEEAIISVGQTDGQEISDAIKEIERLACDGEKVTIKNCGLQTLACYAKKFWERNEHEDAVYLAWDHEIVAHDTPSEQNRGSDQETNSSDSSHDESGDYCIQDCCRVSAKNDLADIKQQESGEAATSMRDLLITAPVATVSADQTTQTSLSSSMADQNKNVLLSDPDMHSIAAAASPLDEFLRTQDGSKYASANPRSSEQSQHEGLSGSTPAGGPAFISSSTVGLNLQPLRDVAIETLPASGDRQIPLPISDKERNAAYSTVGHQSENLLQTHTETCGESEATADLHSTDMQPVSDTCDDASGLDGIHRLSPSISSFVTSPEYVTSPPAQYYFESPKSFVEADTATVVTDAQVKPVSKPDSANTKPRDSIFISAKPNKTPDIAGNATTSELSAKIDDLILSLEGLSGGLTEATRLEQSHSGREDRGVTDSGANEALSRFLELLREGLNLIDEEQ